jgi:site-specific recombinase XerD
MKTQPHVNEHWQARVPILKFLRCRADLSPKSLLSYHAEQLITRSVRAGQRGDNNPQALAGRMHRARGPMPPSSLQRLLVVALKQLNLPDASVHSLSHSFATHMLEAGAHVHTIQKLLGHKQIDSTMVYLHLTHQSTKDAWGLMEELCAGLPR